MRAQKIKLKRKSSDVQEKLAETVAIARRSKKLYTSTAYRLLVFLYLPLILAYPLISSHHTVATVAIATVAFFGLYELPSIVGRTRKPDCTLASKRGSEVQLFLETDYKFDLSCAQSIHFSTGFFPVSPLKLEILKKDGSTLSIKTRIYSDSLINFMRNLRPSSD